MYKVVSCTFEGVDVEVTPRPATATEIGIFKGSRGKVVFSWFASNCTDHWEAMADENEDVDAILQYEMVATNGLVGADLSRVRSVVDAKIVHRNLTVDVDAVADAGQYYLLARPRMQLCDDTTGACLDRNISAFTHLGHGFTYPPQLGGATVDYEPESDYGFLEITWPVTSELDFCERIAFAVYNENSVMEAKGIIGSPRSGMYNIVVAPGYTYTVHLQPQSRDFASEVFIPDVAVRAFCNAGSRTLQEGGCEICFAGFYQDEIDRAECKMCPAGFYCDRGTAVPNPCVAVDGLAQHCPEGSVDSNPCPAGQFCPQEMVALHRIPTEGTHELRSAGTKSDCVAGEDSCPYGSSERVGCPETQACSRGLQCADASMSHVWFDDIFTLQGGLNSTVFAGGLPSCGTSSPMVAEVRGGEIVGLEWGALWCENLEAALRTNFPEIDVFLSLFFTVTMANVEDDTKSIATMEGVSGTNAFSSLFRVPFGQEAEFQMAVDVRVAREGSVLCSINEVELGPVRLYMPLEPPNVLSISPSVVIINTNVEVHVSWEVDSVDADAVYTVFIDREDEPGGLFVQADAKQTTRADRSQMLVLQLAPGNTYRFSVRGSNSKFDGQLSSFSVPIRVPCAPAYFDPGTLGCLSCDGGTYASTAGSTACKKCDLGHYCPRRSAFPVECEVGPDGHAVYCPEGSPAPQICAPGFACPDAHSEQRCPLGSYCPAGTFLAVDCAVGSFCSTPSGQLPCPKGSYCEMGSNLPTSLSAGHYAVDARGDFAMTGGVGQRVCPKGWFCDGGERVACEKVGTYCPEGTSRPVNCTAGYACPASHQQVLCFAGQFCPEGTVVAALCAEGSFCSTPASTSHCTKGSYCPQGSVLPISLSSGHFAVNAGNEFTRSRGIAQEACQPGTFCKGGDIVKCEAGDFCPLGSSDNATCPKGNFCETPKSRQPCTPGTYCPQGQTAALACVEGATCAVPASPELVLIPDTLDLRESEVVRLDDASTTTTGVLEGMVTYRLSLSAKPRATVHVYVAKREAAAAACQKYSDGFEVHSDIFEFTEDNYNVPQVVEATVQRNASTYQGPTRVYFDHEITSEDPEWGSVLLRSVSVSLADDTECTRDGYKYDDDADGQRKCKCSSGTYIAALDDLYCGSALECALCEEGMLCDGEMPLEVVFIQEGYYREDAASTKVVTCPYGNNTCAGNATSGLGLCVEGHEGPLCMLCMFNETNVESRWAWGGVSCFQCSISTQGGVYALTVVFGVVLLSLFVSILRGKNKQKRRHTAVVNTARFSNEKVEDFIEKIQTKYKILVTFTQTLSKVTGFYPVNLPDMFIKFWATIQSVFAPLTFDIGLVPWQCVFEFNFHDRLVAMTLGPIVLVLGIIVTYGIQRLRYHFQGDANDKVLHLQTRCVWIVVILLYTVFPSVSATIFQTFIYDERLDVVYLKADYSIERDDDDHQWHVVYASVMGVVYCMGIPLASSIALYMKRGQIRKIQSIEESMMLLEKDSDEFAADDLPTQAALENLKHDLQAEDPLLAGLSPLYKGTD
jgi:hypothetical protein